MPRTGSASRRRYSSRPSLVAPKIDAIRSLGADQQIGGDRYADAWAAAQISAAESGAMQVPAFDQRETILGQGSVGLELNEQVSDLDTVLVPVGGGGLIAGIAAYFTGAVRIIGVEPDGAPTLTRARANGGPADAPTGSKLTAPGPSPPNPSAPSADYQEPCVPLCRCVPPATAQSGAVGRRQESVACRCCPAGASRSRRRHRYPSDMSDAEWAAKWQADGSAEAMHGQLRERVRQVAARNSAHHEAYVYWAMIIMTRRLARTPGRTGTATDPQVT